MTRDTPKVAAFWFDSLLALACDPSIEISLCRAVFCSSLPHLSLGWTYCTHMALGAPTVAPKQPEISLRSLHFALSSINACVQPFYENIFMWSGFLLLPTSCQSWMGSSHTHGCRGHHSIPKMTRDTPKVATFCFVSLLVLVCNPPMKISLCRAVFCSFLPHLSLGWASCTPMAIRAPTVAPKRPEIPLGSLHFALSAF